MGKLAIRETKLLVTAEIFFGEILGRRWRGRRVSSRRHPACGLTGRLAQWSIRLRQNSSVADTKFFLFQSRFLGIVSHVSARALQFVGAADNPIEILVLPKRTRAFQRAIHLFRRERLPRIQNRTEFLIGRGLE